MRSIRTLRSGDTEVFEFRLVSEVTGEVSGTVFLADPGVNGSFVLTVGVGDTGVPLSPDTLILPASADDLPDAVVFEGIRLLGQAYSAATAPGGSLPPEVARIGKSFVFDRAVRLAQAGLYLSFGETTPDAAIGIVMDAIGSDSARLGELFPDEPEVAEQMARDWDAWDALRRASDAGNDFASALAVEVGKRLDQETLAQLQGGWAERNASRPPHLSFGLSARGPPIFARITDSTGRRLGSLVAGEQIDREIQYSERLVLRSESSGQDQLLFIGAPDSDSYRFEFALAEETQVEISLILPGGVMSQVVYPPVTLPSGSRGGLVWTPNSAPSALEFELDTDGDGVPDQTLAPASSTEVNDPPPRVLGLQQWGKGTEPIQPLSIETGDPLGALVGVLFDEEVDGDTAEVTGRYQVAGNAVRDAFSQDGDRLVFLFLEAPVGPFFARTIDLEGVEDRRGNALTPITLPITPDPDLGPGGVFRGQVVTAAGDPVPFASVRYVQPVLVIPPPTAFLPPTVQDLLVTELVADSEGRFSLDFVLQNDFGNFELVATDPETDESAFEMSRVVFDGQQLAFNLVFRGTGAIEGQVFEEDGNPATAGPIFLVASNVSTGEEFAGFVDSNGQFSFPGRFEDASGSVDVLPVTVGNVILRAARPSDGFTAIATVNIPEAGAVAAQDLVLIPPNRYGGVRGRVLEADGERGAQDVRVFLEAELLTGLDVTGRNFSQGVVAITRTDSAGFFEFESVPTGDIRVVADRQSTFEESSASAFLVEGEELDLTLLLPGVGRTVMGIVVDALGNPVADAAVAGGPTLTRTDADGMFTIEGLPLGPVTIFGQATDSLALGTVDVDSIATGEQPLIRIQLEPVGDIGGIVVEADDATPVPGQRVQLWSQRPAGVIAEAFADDEGRFLFERFPVGEYSVRAIRESDLDGGMAFTSIRFAGDERLGTRVRFRGKGAIEGRVIQSNGTPAITDIIITRKVWRIRGAGEGRPPNPYLEFVRNLAELSDEFEDLVQRALAETGTSLQEQQFFLLEDEIVVLRSDILGPGGEVTGRFEFDEDVAGGPFTVFAGNPFFTPATVQGAIPVTTDPAARRVDVGDIVLDASVGRVRGTVFLPDGETPVGEGVTVRIQSLNTRGSVRTAGGDVALPVFPELDVVTDPDGRFDFPLVLAGGFAITADTGVPDPAVAAGSIAEIRTERFEDLNVRLFGETRGVAPPGGGGTNIVPVEEAVEVEVRLQDAAGVHVAVVENDGTTPVGFAEVSLMTGSRLDDDADPIEVTADANGEVEIFPVTEGMFNVDARKPSSPARGKAAGDIPIDPPAGFVQEVTVTLGAVTSMAGDVVSATTFGTVEGTVFTATGDAVTTPVQVTLRARGVEFLASTDENGLYRVENVPNGFFRVEVFEPFTARTGTTSGTIVADGEVVTADVMLVGLGTVIGQVFDGDGQTAVAAADVILFAAGNFTDPIVSRSDASGGFFLPGVPLGDYMVKATDVERGLTGEADGFMEADGDLDTTDVFLEGSGQVVGIVYGPGVFLDSNGNPVDSNGAPLADPPLVANGSVELSRGSSFSQTVQTDAEGRFASSPFLKLGLYEILARPIQGEDGSKATVELVFDGEIAEVSLALAGRGAVEGVVLDSLGAAPVQFADVQLVSASPFSAGERSTVTAADGSFSFADVPVGEFSIGVSANLEGVSFGGAVSSDLDQDGAIASFRDDDGDASRSAIRLEPAGTVLGRVVLPSTGVPVEGAVVELRGGDLAAARVTQPDGSFEFAALPLGAFTLLFNDPVSQGIASTSAVLDQNGEVEDLGDIVVDTTAPAVVGVDPSADAVRVDPQTSIRVTFSEAIDPSSVGDATFRVTVDGQDVPGARAIPIGEPDVVVFVPLEPFPDLSRVRVDVAGDEVDFEGQVLVPGVSDLAGRGLSQSLTAFFTTRDATPPVLQNISPSPGLRDLSLSTVVRLEFDEAVDLGTAGSVSLVDQDGSEVPGALSQPASLGDRVLVFTPTQLLADRAYTFRLVGPIEDTAGNPIEQGAIETSFGTIDTRPPVFTGLGLPSEAERIDGNTIAITPSFENPDDVAFVEFFVDGQLVATVQDPPFVFQLELTGGPGAAIEVSAVAVDPFGNRSDASQGSLQLAANEPPFEVSVSLPDGGVASQGDTVRVVVSARDDVGLQSLSFTANDGAVGGDQSNVAGTEASSEFNLTIPDGFPTGSTIAVRGAAIDTSGAMSVSPAIAEITVVDQLAPTVVIVSPAAATAFAPGEVFTVRVRAEDAGNVSLIALDVSGPAALVGPSSIPVEPPGAQALATFQVVVSAEGASSAEITLAASATDAVGNESGTPATVVVRVADSMAPVVTSMEVVGSAAAEVEAGSGATVLVRATDDLGTTEIELDGPSGPVTQTFAPSSSVARSFPIQIPADLSIGDQLTLVARARDASGNESTPSQLVLTVQDLTAPATEIVDPLPGTQVDSGASFGVTVRASDAVGVTDLELQSSVGSVSPPEFVVDPAASLVERVFDVSVPGGAQDGQLIILEARARDSRLNDSSPASITVEVRDITPPQVVTVSPPDRTTDVITTGSVVLQLSEPVQASAGVLSAGSAQIRSSAGDVPAAISVANDGRSLTITPLDVLSGLTLYTVRVEGLRDSADNEQSTPFESSFTTRGAEVTPLVAELLPVIPYTSVGDSPLSIANGGPFDVDGPEFFLEDAESGVIDLPRLMSKEAVPAGPGPSTDSVDADDGAIDGSGAGGTSISVPSDVVLRFDRIALDGDLPTHVGFVWTGPERIDGPITVQIEAFDAAGATVASSDPISMAPSGIEGDTAEDRFFGASFDGGIAALRIFQLNGGDSMEIDHVQYGLLPRDAKLDFDRRILGVPLGEPVVVTLRLSRPIGFDLPIFLSPLDATVAGAPADPLVVPAGSTEATANLTGFLEGSTGLVAISPLGSAFVLVSVSEPTSGQTIEVSANPVGVGVPPPAVGGAKLVLRRPGDFSTVSIEVVDVPATGAEQIGLGSTDSTVARIVSVVLPAGQTRAVVEIEAGVVGDALLSIDVDGSRSTLEVEVGDSPPEIQPHASAMQVGVGVQPPPPGTTVALPRAGETFEVEVALLSSPATGGESITFTSSDASVGRVLSVVLPPGATSGTVFVEAVGEGDAVLSVSIDGQVTGLEISVARPSDAIALAAPVGAGVLPEPPTHVRILTAGVSRELTVPFLGIPGTTIPTSTSNPDVALVLGDEATIAPGGTEARFQVATGEPGEAIVQLQIGPNRVQLRIVVGDTPAVRLPQILSPETGIEVSAP